MAPDHKTAVSNLAIALFALGRYHEACLTAPRALNINPAYPYFLYVPGFSIISEHGGKTETHHNLEGAAPRFPNARLAASKLLAEMGRTEDAALPLRSICTPHRDKPPCGNKSRQSSQGFIGKILMDWSSLYVQL
ncbi:MAG: hypothetical protein ACJ74Z_11780 [Bryobacteraceae bacterium]